MYSLFTFIVIPTAVHRRSLLSAAVAMPQTLDGNTRARNPPWLDGSFQAARLEDRDMSGVAEHTFLALNKIEFVYQLAMQRVHHVRDSVVSGC